MPNSSSDPIRLEPVRNGLVAIPETFDWVSARSKCRPAEIFQKLREIVEHDAATASAVRDRKYEFKSHNDGRFVVFHRDESLNMAVDSRVFSLEGSAIRCRDRRQEVVLEARPYLYAEGVCMLEIDDKPHRLWQVSRIALEDLFFPS